MQLVYKTVPRRNVPTLFTNCGPEMPNPFQDGITPKSWAEPSRLERQAYRSCCLLGELPRVNSSKLQTPHMNDKVTKKCLYCI